MSEQPMTPAEYLDALLALPKLYGGEVSPDSKSVAWMWAGIGSTIDIYAAPTDASEAPTRLTDTTENTLFLSWAPGNESIVVAQDYQGNERYQLFQINLVQPGVLHPLTEPTPNYYIRGGQIHSNGRWLIYAANFDSETRKEIEPSILYRHDLETDELIPLARPQKGSYYVPRLNPTGTHILYNRKDIHPSGYPLWLVDIEGKSDREIINVGQDKKVFGRWFPDGKRILVRSETPTHYKIGVWELDSGILRWLVDDAERNIEDAYVPFGSEQAVIVEHKEARSKVSLLNVTSGDETIMPEIAGNLIPIAPLGAAAWVGRYYGSQQITDLVRFSLLDFQPSAFVSLTQVKEKTKLSANDLAPAEGFRWKSVDGLGIQGWLYRAKDKVRGTIVYVHGGPTSHVEDRLDDEFQFYVSQGFNVFMPNYRGSTGFSRAFREAIKTDGWGGREQDDIRTGIEALIAINIAEKGKVGITGTSYGGYCSWCAITRFPLDTLAAAASICGMTDLVVDYQTTRPDVRPYSEEMMGGRPDELPQKYHDRSPINFVSNIKGRLLIVQGLKDPNVTPENVRVVRAALDKAGIKYQLLTFENEGHGIKRTENRKILYQRLVDFFSDAFKDV
jgi:dipeptidyl aminopeptidase/acylaminoacyl peptidase